MNLATICNTICSDEPNYEKAFKIFGEYANQERFKSRVESGEELKLLHKLKSREKSREIFFQLLPKRPISGVDFSQFTKRAERELFKKAV